MTGSVLRRALDELRDAVVVVTGGGRGLGRSIAEGFAREGSTVVIVGRNADTLATAAAEMAPLAGRVHPMPADVADEAAMAALSEAVLARFGRVDVLVNNAGINPFYRRAEDTPVDEWRKVLDVNLTGVFLGSVRFGRAMLERGSGSIINVTSIAGHVGLLRTTAYCAAKGGVEMMTRQLAMEWADRGVRVNAVAPAYFETDLTAGLRANESLSSRILSRVPMARFGTADELTGACLYLASSAASYVTGQTIMVDGGWKAG
jgi:NAD(P)-dependent dehydrogenase (short-subunit alcohol dehydrogenase family)